MLAILKKIPNAKFENSPIVKCVIMIIFNLFFWKIRLLCSFPKLLVLLKNGFVVFDYSLVTQK